MIGGIVLAAGSGTRFGSGSKLLADLDGRPLLEHSVAAQCAVPELERVVVVLGARAEEVLRRVEFGRAEPIVCDDWDSGQSSSLRRGAAELRGASKIVVTLGDEPLITPAAITLLASQPGGTRAVYGGRPGHPVVLGAEELAELSRLTGDRGARDLVRSWRTVECSDLCTDQDVDTPEDLEAIRREARAVL